VEVIAGSRFMSRLGQGTFLEGKCKWFSHLELFFPVIFPFLKTKKHILTDFFGENYILFFSAEGRHSKARAAQGWAGGLVRRGRNYPAIPPKYDSKPELSI
jgi:hypothetical protein